MTAPPTSSPPAAGPRPLPARSPLYEAPALPAALVKHFNARLRARSRTVYDARGILAPLRDRLLCVEIDSGAEQRVRLYGLYVDVVHTPAMGYGVVLRDLSTVGDRAQRREAKRMLDRVEEGLYPGRVTIPMKLVRGASRPLLFLRQAPSRWPMPADLVSCPACEREGRGLVASTGRFCVRCGAVVRKGPGAKMLGAGFAVMQTLLREVDAQAPELVRKCARCGAFGFHSDVHCTKCKHPLVPPLLDWAAIEAQSGPGTGPTGS